MGDTCLSQMNKKRTMIIIGFIGGYKEGGIRGLQVSQKGATIPVQLLMKSASLRGFFLFHYNKLLPQAFTELLEVYHSGELKIHTDRGSGPKSTQESEFSFTGLEGVADAVDYLYSRK